MISVFVLGTEEEENHSTTAVKHKVWQVRWSADLFLQKQQIKTF